MNSAGTVTPSVQGVGAVGSRRSGLAKTDSEELYGDPLAIWREWADDVRGMPIDSGHHMAEEAPAAVASAIASFLG
jgi:thioesterase domain-containing protein